MFKSAVVATLVAAGSVASAADIVDFSFANAAGVFRAASPGNGALTIDAVDAAPFRTSMTVSAILPASGTADFDDGFVSRSNFADLAIIINVAGVVGSGAITITDDDGDTLTASISGLFDLSIPGAVFFNGSLSSGNLNDNAGPNSDFNGTDGGSFAISDFPFADANGAFSLLFPRAGAANPFSQSFSDTPVLGNGFLVPAPASLALAAVGGLVAVRRRR